MGKKTLERSCRGVILKFIFNPGEYESAKYFSDYLGDEEVHYRQKSRSSSKNGGSTSTSDQDKTKKMFSPEEFLKLPAGNCIFINPAYANAKEASIPMKLRVKIGNSEIQRRNYGEENFERVMKGLIEKNQHSAIGHQEIKKRIDSLGKVIPSRQQIEQKRLARIAKIKNRLEEIDEMR